MALDVESFCACVAEIQEVSGVSGMWGKTWGSQKHLLEKPILESIALHSFA